MWMTGGKISSAAVCDHGCGVAGETGLVSMDWNFQLVEHLDWHWREQLVQETDGLGAALAAPGTARTSPAALPAPTRSAATRCFPLCYLPRVFRPLG